MDQPFDLPIKPMLAKAVATVPQPDSVPGGLVYEPKWDGFRCILLRDGDEVELASRGSRPLTRYFPELAQAARQHLPEHLALDGEVVVRSGPAGAAHLDWEALSQRIHPAASRVNRLAKETPAQIIFFDILADGDTSLLDVPFEQRRQRLTRLLRGLEPDAPFHVTRATDDQLLAQDWFTRFEGAGLDGVVAKPRAGVYTPGKRTMWKIKHKRTAEAVPIGYRIHKSGAGVGSLLLGMYDESGTLRGVGGIGAFTARRRVELVSELEHLVLRDDAGRAVTGETDRSRFSAAKDVSFVRLRPELVVEVAFDQLEGRRFRHAVTFLRWRPDRDPRSCTLDQVDRAAAYDLDEVLATD